MSERELLRRTTELAADFLESLDERPIWPHATVEELRDRLGGRLQVWDGRAAIRISVSNSRTGDEDVARTLAAFRAALAPSDRHAPAGSASPIRT